jgi:predicted RNase H-like nuclease
VRRTFRTGDWVGLARVLAAIAADLGIPTLAAWARRVELAAPTKALQDEVDAVLCVLIGLLIEFSPASTCTVGDAVAGYIVTPCPPALRPELQAAAARVGAPCTFG